MYNTVFLIGRLTSEPSMNTTEKGKKVMTIDLAVPRSYKNADGIYETDFVRCVLWEGIANRTSEYCHKGDLIAVRGQIRISNYVNDKNEKKYKTEILVEKVCFLSSKANEKETQEETEL